MIIENDKYQKSVKHVDKTRLVGHYISDMPQVYKLCCVFLCVFDFGFNRKNYSMELRTLLVLFRLWYVGMNRF